MKKCYGDDNGNDDNGPTKIIKNWKTVEINPKFKKQAQPKEETQEAEPKEETVPPKSEEDLPTKELEGDDCVGGVGSMRPRNAIENYFVS